MMEKIPFDPKELEVSGEYRGIYPGSKGIPVLNTPITAKENFRRFAFNEEGGPLWMPSYPEIKMFNPQIVPENIARAIVVEMNPYNPKDDPTPFHKDFFGVEWEYVPTAGGSMVRPGKPFLEDLEDWEEKIIPPDLSQYDWEGCVANNQPFLHGDNRALKSTVFTGFFERLISFIDMAPALLALIDEDEQEYVHGIFDRLATFYDELFGYYEKYFHLDAVWFHDDWGSQRAPLFSADTCYEMLVPYFKRVVESAHKHGMAFEFHSCGKNELLVPCMIEAGIDMWQGQDMNDYKKLYKEYGKDIKFCVDIAPLPEGASDQQIRDHVNAFLDDFPENVYVSVSMYNQPEVYTALYEETRKRFSS